MVSSDAADEVAEMTLEQTGLSGMALAAARDAGFLRPTTVQAALIPAVLDGGDLVVRAPAGTGRVAGLALATAQRLAALDLPLEGDSRPVVAVVAFTADDVQQVAAAFEWALGARGVVVRAHSGTRIDRVAAALRRGAVCVVGTPGRVSDLVDRGALEPEALRIVVMLEVDLLLSVGAGEGLSRLLQAARTRGEDGGDVQVLAVTAGMDRETEEFVGSCIPQATELQFTEMRGELGALASVLREVAEDEKTDVVVGMVGNTNGKTAPMLVITRTGEEAAALSAEVTRLSPEADVSVRVDGEEDKSEEGGVDRRVIFLHLPIRLSEWTSAVDSGEAKILISPAEYWDYVRTDLIQVEPVSQCAVAANSSEEVSTEAAQPAMAAQPVQERGRKKRSVSGPATASTSTSAADTPALTEAERMQRRYIRRDASRKIECIDPEDATKEAARLVKESMVETARLQAFAPEVAGAEDVVSEQAPGAQDRAVAEMLRRREVDERLREARRKLMGQERAAEPVEAQVETEPLDEREQSLVAWIRNTHAEVKRLLERSAREGTQEYRVLAEHLLTSSEATDLVAALLQAMAPMPATVGLSADVGAGIWTRLFISVGRTARLGKEQLEELLCDKAGLTAEQIGRIDVLSRYTFLEVRREVADHVIDRLSGEVIRGREITVARAKPHKNG
ncbi:MAG: DEAD/DEAH box helicase [Actinobacteria bacterium]|nr:DEAD/DEAH box helicase [Actinomycetota bacterium]